MTDLRAAKGVVEGSHVQLGWPPTAIVLWWTRQTEPGIHRGSSGGIGFHARGESAAVAWSSADNAAPTRTRRAAADAAVLDTEGSRGVASVCDDGFDVHWDDGWTIHYLALGTPCEGSVGWIDSRQTNVDVRADALLVAPSAATEPGLVAAIGAAARDGQAGASYTSRDGAPEGDVGGAQRSDAAIVVAADRRGFDALARLNHDDAGFSLDWERAWPAPQRFPYLALSGIRCSVGVDRSPQSPARKRTRVGFRPDALFLFSWGLRTRETPTDIGRLCLGGATRDASGCAGWDDRDTDARPTTTHVCSSTDEILVVTNTQTGGVHASARLRSLDRSGFTLDWTVLDAPDREFAYVALAAPRR